MKCARRTVLPISGALLLLLLCAFLSLRLGSTHLSHTAFWNGLLGKKGASGATLILHELRLPRMLAGIFAGAGLALSGSLLQIATDNPLAAPNVLGINAGAGFFVIVTMALFPTAFALLPLSALLGGILTALLILAVSVRANMDKTAVVLCGVAVSALFGAGISFLSIQDADLLASYTDFSIGGLRGVTMRELWLPMVIILFCFCGAQLLCAGLRLFCLGDSLAHSLGVSVERVRFLALSLAATCAAAAVSFAGLLGFVGLLVPHIARKTARGNLRTELILSPIGGGILLLSADLAGRLLFTPTEIPVGIFTALLGVPFFILLLLRRCRHA